MNVPQMNGYGHAYERLLGLGKERLSILEGKMAKAEPAGMIADYIQGEWKECLDVQRNTLTRQLNRYRHHMVTPKMAVLYQAGQGGQDAKKALHTLYEQINVIDGLEDLLQLQLTRLQKALQLEAPLPTLLDSVSKEVDMVRKIYLDLGHLRMETGTMPVAKKRVRGEVLNNDGTKSAFEYTVEKDLVPQVSAKFSDFLDRLDAQLGYARTVSADAADPQSDSEDHHPD